MRPVPKASVLVIDDDEIVLAAMEDILQRHDFAVTTRTTPIGVTRVIIDCRIDVVVLDVNMPVIQGDSVARLLRGWDRLRDVPVVIMSGLAAEHLQAIRENLPDAVVLPKTQMRSALASTVKRLYAAREKGDSRKELGDASRMTADFFSHLSECMTAYRFNWLAYAALAAHQLPRCQARIKPFIAQAFLLGVRDVADVLTVFHDSIEDFGRSPIPSAAMSHAVLTTIGALQDAADHHEGKLQVGKQVLVSALAKVRSA